MSRFRIVIADDDPQNETLIDPLREVCPEADIWQVKCLRPEADAFPYSPGLAAQDWRSEFLFRCDILILDMNIDCASEYQPQDSVDQWRFGGEAFIARFWDEWPGQAILMWTGHDDDPMPFANALTLKHIQKGWRGPLVAKSNKNSEESTLRMVEWIEAMYRRFQNCATLTDLAQIEFAASHDMPVLIVGESGTGKEGIAHQIHQRWRTETMKEFPDLDIPKEPAVVNCAGLSENLARSELFGFVKGSYTGADDHRVGKCLLACGHSVTSLGGNGKKKDADKDRVEEYAELIEKIFEKLIDKQKGSGLDIALRSVSDKPFGTLFLDEFGDLPPSIQALVLRYLQSFEVQPLGYPGIIKNARVRIIAATSDPTVATMVGESLGGRFREIGRNDLREDLVFRVKGQVIRVQPVDESNIESEFRREIEKQRDRGNKAIAWDTTKGGALDYIVEELGKVLAANREATVNDRLPPFAFGHRREIGRIVSLANAFVAGAANRGMRGLPRTVTRDVVAGLWRPSMVAISGAAPICPPLEMQVGNLFTCSLTGTIIDPTTAKAAVLSLHDRVKGKADLTTTSALGRSAPAVAFLLTWFAAYHVRRGKDKWNDRAALLAFEYRPQPDRKGKADQPFASVKSVALTLFDVVGEDAVPKIDAEATRWKEWVLLQPDISWPFKHEDLPPSGNELRC